MNRNTKKGFTIVELIIVIAVIAVLAAVLIPTFSNLINQAQQAKDTALVSDLNKGLKMSGKEFDTMHDALTAVEENVGINVAKINAVASESEILWDSVNQCFVYLKGGETTPTYIPDSKSKDVNGQYDYWQIVKAPTTTNVYSQYISGTDYTADVTVSTGLDVGENTGIKNVTYSHTGTAQSVVVRTDGGKLTVNAAADTLKRYGTADSVQITAIAPQSYHEYGTVIGNIELASGRVVMESGSTAAAIKITAEASKIVDGTATIAVDSKTSNVSVVVPADVKTAIDDSKDSKNTLPTTNVISDNTVIENMSKFAGGIGTEASPYLISSVNQWMNVKEISAQGKNFKVVTDLDFHGINDITIDTFVGTMDFDNHSIKGVSEDNTIYGYLFQIVGNDTVSTKICNANLVVEGYTSLVFQVQSAKEFILENITATGSAEIVGDNNYTPFISRIVSLSNSICNVVMRNCINNANITSDACTGVFIGKVSDGGAHTSAKIEFDHCVNNGTVVSTVKSVAAMLFANSCTFANQRIEDITIKNCENNGRILGTTEARLVAADWASGYGWNAEKENEYRKTIGSNFINGSVDGFGAIQTGKLTVQDGVFVLPTIDGANRYTLSFGIWNTAYKNNEKCSWGQGSVVFAIDAKDIATASIKAMKFIQYDYSAQSTQTIVEHEEFGTKYYTCGNNYVYKTDLEEYGNADYVEIKLQPTVSYVAYNAAGIPLAVYRFNLESLA